VVMFVSPHGRPFKENGLKYARLLLISSTRKIL